jgi:hypothetical protein
MVRTQGRNCRATHRGPRPDTARMVQVKRFAAAVGALALLTSAALVPQFSRVGPVLLAIGPMGVHALDIGVLAVAVPLAVALLRYVDSGG